MKNTWFQDWGWVLLLALVIRLGYVLSLERIPAREPFDGYAQIAANLLEGRGLNPTTPRHFHLRTPTYPLFVAAVWSVVSTPARYGALAGAQVGLSVGTCGLLMAIMAPVLGLRAARMTGVLFACSPSSIAFCALIYTETLQMFLVALAAFVAMRLAARGKVFDMLMFGVLWGILGLNRPESTYVLPVLVLPFLLNKQTPGLQKLSGFVVMLLACVLVMAPWVARNYRVYGAFILHVPQTGMGLYGGSYPNPPMYGRGWVRTERGDVSYWEQPEFLEVTAPYWDRSALANRPGWRDEVLASSARDFLVIDRVLAAAAKRQISAHPLTYVWNMMFHIYALWGRPAAWDALDLGPARLVWLGGYLIYLGLAGLGIVTALRNSRRNALAMNWLGFAIWSTIVLLPIVTEPRYHVSAGIFLTGFAGAGLARLMAMKSKVRTPRLDGHFIP